MAKNKKAVVDGELPKADQLPVVASPQPRGPSRQMIELFAARSDLKVTRITRPPMIKVKQLIESQAAIDGVIEDILPSFTKSIKSEVLLMRHPGTGRQFCFPVTAVLSGALSTHFKVDREKLDLRKAIGLHIVIQGLEASTTKTGQPVNLLDIGVVE